MKQLVGLVANIRRRNTEETYYERKFFASLHQAEIPPLEEILGVSSEETNSFDDKTNAALEKRALELLEERKLKAANGR